MFLEPILLFLFLYKDFQGVRLAPSFSNAVGKKNIIQSTVFEKIDFDVL